MATSNPIQQTGNVTPGHLASWATDAVLQDAGPATQIPRVLASLRGANFAITTDQAILFPSNIVAFAITQIIVTNASRSLTTAVGGFYPAASKGGTPIVSAAQAYSALSTIGTALMNPTIASFGTTTRFSSTNLPITTIFGVSQLEIFFSLTTGQGAPSTADIYISGIDLT